MRLIRDDNANEILIELFKLNQIEILLNLIAFSDVFNRTTQKEPDMSPFDQRCNRLVENRRKSDLNSPQPSLANWSMLPKEGKHTGANGIDCCKTIVFNNL